MGVLLDASAQHAGRTGREILTIGAKTMGLPDSRVDEMLALVSLDETEAKRRMRNYSLGMRQRLGIAHALLGDPSVLILDEPANGLDPAGIRWMRGLLKGYADRGGTVLLSSHLLNEVEQIADEMLLIGRGKIVAQGTKAELLANTGGTGAMVVALDNDQLTTALRPRGWRTRRSARASTSRPCRSRSAASPPRTASCSPTSARSRAGSRTSSSSSPPTPSATTSPMRPPRQEPRWTTSPAPMTLDVTRPPGSRSAGWSASRHARCSTPGRAGGC